MSIASLTDKLPAFMEPYAKMTLEKIREPISEDPKTDKAIKCE
jgi:hypothetical protein